jgi:glycosyltransferase involved in cell wall biosynthesis
MNVLHVITGLHTGGAEAMLYKLVRSTHETSVRHSVVSLMDEGTYGAKLTAEGVSVSCLRMRRGVPDPLALVRLVRLLRRERPDVVQGWMYHANLLAGLAASVARVPVVWGIHHADVDRRNAKRLSYWTNSLSARLSGVIPSRVICCAESALRSHTRLGYRADRMLVIPNGFETDRFKPDAVARRAIRGELAIPDDAPVVGLVARFHPDKDHRNFIAAARQVARANARVVFVLAGDGVDLSNEDLRRWIDEAGIREHVRLLGRRSDVPEVLAGIDVLASSSRAEGFPQVLGEAMLCGVPCVTTDCGDSRDIVGRAGRIVAPRDPSALARSILEVLAVSPAERAGIGLEARESIRARYDIASVATRYLDLYRSVVSER